MLENGKGGLLFIENIKLPQKYLYINVWADVCTCGNSWHSWHKISTKYTGGWPTISGGQQATLVTGSPKVMAGSPKQRLQAGKARLGPKLGQQRYKV